MCVFIPALAPFTFHWYVGVVPPFIGVAVNVTNDPGQKGFDDATMVTPAGKLLLTVINSVLLVIGLFIGQEIDDVNVQLTRSPFRGLYVKVELFVPEFTPLIFHWYIGKAPSLTGIAVKVTDDPAQNGFAEGLIVIPTTNTLSITINNELLTAGFPVGQVTFEIRTQVTISPLFGI
jgi:RNase P/RNase MRP subunit p29